MKIIMERLGIKSTQRPKDLERYNFTSVLLVAHIIVLCSFVITALSSPMDSDYVKRKLANSTNEYALLFNQAKDTSVEDIQSEFLTKCKLARCEMFDPGLEEHNFILAVETNSESIYILTDSVAAWNRMFKNEHLVPTNASVALDVALEALTLTRAQYTSFQVVRTQADLEKRGFKHPDGFRGIRISPPRLKQLAKGQYAGDVFILLGRDLVRRSIKIGQDGLEFTDMVLAHGAVNPLTPHE